MGRTLSELLGLSEASHAAGDWTQGLAYAREMIAAYPDSPEGYNQQGLYELSLDQFPEAERSLTHALALDFSLLDAHFNLGVLHARQGQHQKALAHYKQVVLNRADDPETLALMATSAAACGMLQEAEVFYSEALRLRPTWVEVATALSWLLIEDGRNAEARELLDAFVGAVPNAPMPMVMALGILCEQTGQSAAAMQHFHAVVTADDQNEEAFYHLGLCAQQNKLYVEAETFFSRAIHLKPDYVQAIAGLGKLLMKEEKWTDAAMVFEEWQRVSGNAAAQAGAAPIDAAADAEIASLLLRAQRKLGKAAPQPARTPVATVAANVPVAPARQRVSLSIDD